MDFWLGRLEEDRSWFGKPWIGGVGRRNPPKVGLGKEKKYLYSLLEKFPTSRLLPGVWRSAGFFLGFIEVGFLKRKVLGFSVFPGDAIVLVQTMPWGHWRKNRNSGS